MRIAIFSDNFYPELSGISDSIITLTKQLAARGHFIHFYVPYYAVRDYDAAKVSMKEIDLGPNVQITRFLSLPYSTTGTGHARFVIPVGIRAAAVARFHPDVIHTQLFFGVGLEALAAARILSVPLVGTNHTALKEFLSYNPIRSSWLDKTLLNYVNWYYKQCNFVTAPSHSVFDEMITLGFKNPRTRVISNPIDIHVFRPLDEKNELKKKFGFSNATIIHAGRLSDERNPDVLVKALAIIKKTVPDAMLAFAGKGTSEKKLSDLATSLGIGDSVKFLGFVDKPTLNKAYNAAEVFAIASTGDTQSLVMMQAMASGIPVIGVRARALPEYINAKNGFIVEPGDAAAMAERSIYLLKHPVGAKKMGTGARAYAEQFSEEAIATQWEAIYQNAITRYTEEHIK